MSTFDEQDAIEFIRFNIGDEMSASIADDDTIFEVIDLIFDFFDDLSDDDDFEVVVEEDGTVADDDDFARLANYVAKGLKKSGHDLPFEVVKALSAGEILYENSLDPLD